MKVREVMEINVIAVPAGASYEEVARLLYKHNKSGAPVVDAEGRVIGAVSEKDLFRIMYPYYRSFYEHPECYADLENRECKMDEIRRHPVEVFMSREVVAIDPEAPVMRAGALMLARGINRLPVIENGKLVGMVSRRDIYRKILEQRLGLGTE